MTNRVSIVEEINPTIATTAGAKQAPICPALISACLIVKLLKGGARGKVERVDEKVADETDSRSAPNCAVATAALLVYNFLCDAEKF